MAFSLTWIPEVLRSVDLKVAEVDGWQDRGRGDMGPVVGVICHHTAGPAGLNMPSLHTLVNGRSDLPGPLAQLGLGRDGTYYVIAAGRCNHAGRGIWQGLTRGNTNFIGIEAENTGLKDDPWPDVQIDAYHRGVAAILLKIGKSAEFCAGHKEYALPRGRKSDPSFDMQKFREEVSTLLESRPLPSSPSIPATDKANRPTLRRGSDDTLVEVIQKKVGVAQTGHFGPETEAAVRLFQRTKKLVPDGIVGPKTWAALDKAP